MARVGELRGILGEVYADPETIRYLLEDAGVDSTKIDLKGPSEYVLRRGLEAAWQQNRIIAVCDTALADRGCAAIHERLQAWRAHGLEKPGQGTSEAHPSTTSPQPPPASKGANPGSDEAPRVLLSYSHDSPEHAELVLKLANQLRRDGVDAWIDRYEPHPSMGWPRWMKDQLQRARFVLVVCTETYLRRWERRETPGVGLGAAWEAHLLQQELYEDRGDNARIIPLCFDDAGAFVPKELRPYTRYHPERSYEPLCRHLTDQLEVEAPALGSIRRREALPTPSPVSTGAPDELSHTSPFVTGRPVEGPEFFGRERQIRHLADRIEQLAPVQILGERRMGKTSLLRHLRPLLPSDRPAVELSAAELRSPEDLVLAIAEKLDMSDRIRRTLDPSRSALASLKECLPLSLLLDEADALGEPDGRFGDDDLNLLRGFTQDRSLLWISASCRNVRDYFREKRWTSAFLNDADEVYAGPFEEDEALTLLAILGSERASTLLDAVGPYPFFLQLVADRVWREELSAERALTVSLDRIDRELSSWWKQLPPTDLDRLRRVEAGLRPSELGRMAQGKLEPLLLRGLVWAHGDRYEIPPLIRESILDHRG